jgi:galactokinase
VAAAYPEEASFAVDDIPRNLEPVWARYPAGVLWALREAGVDATGFEAVIGGELPVGAGLSSSAAIEVATALFILALAGASLPKEDLARLCRRAENEFVGVNCGIMDQFAAVFGAPGRAIYLDCRDLDHELVPFDSSRLSLLILDTTVKHELGSTAYHQRQQECRDAVTELSRWLGPKASLREVDLEEFAQVERRLPDVPRQRARHVISENQRVLDSVEALKVGDDEHFGRLMDASHESLRNDYEVSCAELDRMVELAREEETCLGARMTGGGFGGAVVALFPPGSVAESAERIIRAYRESTGFPGRWLVSKPAEGGWSEHLHDEEG